METIERLRVSLEGTAAGLIGMLAQAESAVSSVFGRIAKLGTTLTLGVSLPLVGLAGTATKTFAGFESTLQQTVGLAGVAQAEIGGISDEILRMGPELGQRPTAMADAFYFLSSSGLSGANAMEAMRRSAMAATAGLGEQKVIADIISSAMNAFGSANLNAAQATDVLVATVREGKGEPAQLAAALAQVMPIAASMGAQFHEVGAAVAGMTRTGASAETATMQLKNIFASIVGPSRESANAMAQLGLSSQGLQQQLRTQGLLSVLQTLKDKFGGNTAATEAVFGNIRALTGILDLLGPNMRENVGIFQRMQNTTGALDHAFAAVSDTVRVKWMKLTASIEAGLIQIGNLLAPTFKAMLDRLQGAVQAWNALSDNTKKSIVIFASIAAAAGPVLLLVAALGKLAMFLVGMSPMLAVVGGIAVGLGVMAQAAGGWGALWDRARGLIVGAGEAIAGAFARVFDFGNRLWQIMGVRLVSAGIVLTGVFMGLWEAAKLVGSAMAAAFDFITGPAEALGGVTGSLLALDGVLIAGLATWAALRVVLAATVLLLDVLGVKQVLLSAALLAYNAVLFSGVVAMGLWRAALVVGVVAATALRAAHVGLLTIGALLRAAWYSDAAAFAVFMTARKALMLIDLGITLLLTAAWWAGVLAMRGATAATAAYNVVVAGAMGAVAGLAIVMTAFKLTVATLTVGIPILTAAVGLFVASLATGHAVIWLVNAAVSVLSVQTVVAGALMATAFAGVGIVLYALWQTTRDLFALLGRTESFSGPLAQITAIFGEWWDMVKKVAHAFTVDFQTGVDMAKSALGVFVSDIQAMFPPLWEAIKDGFNAVWTFVAQTFVIRLKMAIRSVLTAMSGAAAQLLGIDVAGALTGIESTEKLNAQLQAAQGNAGVALTNVANNLGAGLAAANVPMQRLQELLAGGLVMPAAIGVLQSEGFDQGQIRNAIARVQGREEFTGMARDVEATDAMRQVREALGPGVMDIMGGFGLPLTSEIANRVSSVSDAVAPAAQQAGQQIGEQFAGGLKDSMIKGIDAVAVGSAEAVARVGSYLAGFADMRAVGAAVGNAVVQGPQVNVPVNAPAAGAAPAPVDAAARAGGQEMVDVLKEIKAVLVEKLDSLISGQGEQIQISALGGV